MTTQLTPEMKRILSKLNTTEWKTSASIGESINVLDILRSKGLVQEKTELGGFYSPRTGIKWRKL